MMTTKLSTRPIMEPSTMPRMTNLVAQTETSPVAYSTDRVEGPQLSLNKTYLSMMTQVDKTEQDYVIVTNNGTAMINYEWRKFRRPNYIDAKPIDPTQRFFCHYGRSSLKPGESRKFVFTFRSTELGIFFEEWELLTEPLLIYPISLLSLSGTATKEDQNIARREDFEERMNRHAILHNAQEILDDIIDGVKTPIPEDPNMADPEVFRVHFESQNKNEKLWYTPYVMRGLFNLLYEVLDELKISKEGYYWNANVAHIDNLIKRIDDYNLRKNSYRRRLLKLIHTAKVKPIERSIAYNVSKSILSAIANDVPQFVKSLREEMAMPELVFEDPIDLTPEEIAKKQEEYKKKKEDFYKKQKKKLKEEDEKKEYEDYKVKLGGRIKNSIGERLSKFDEDISLSELEQTLQHNEMMDYWKFEELSRKYALRDVDLEGKSVVVRIDLDIGIGEKLEEVKEEMTIASNANQKKPNSRLALQKKLKGNQTPSTVKEQPAKMIYYLENPITLLNVIPTIKYCSDHLANRVFVVGNLGEKLGHPSEKFSMKPVFEFLAKRVEQQIVFMEDCVIENYEEKLENEEIPESCIIFLENLNFHPEEFGFKVEQKVKEDGELAEQVEPVDCYKIDNFISKISNYGEIYVNDALEASLGNSNSVAKLKTDLNVMGLRMAAQIRALHNLFKSYETPLVAVLGGNQIEEKLLVINNSLIENFAEIFIFGHIALHFLKFMTADVKGEHTDTKYDALIEKVLKKAKERGVKIYVPLDGIYVQPQDDMTLEDAKREFNKTLETLQGEKTLNMQLDSDMEEDEVAFEEEEEKAQKERIPSIPAIPKEEIDFINLENCNYKEEANIVQSYTKHRVEKVVKPVPESVNQSMQSMNESASSKQLIGNKKAAAQGKPQAAAVAPSPSPQLKVETSIIQTSLDETFKGGALIEYGPKSLELLKSRLQVAKRIFWDGDLQLNSKSVAAESNKMIVEELRKIHNDNQDVKPNDIITTVAHGKATETVIQDTLARVKFEQGGRDGDAESVGGQEESRLDKTINTMGDISEQEQITTYTCFEGNFTLRLLQGFSIPSVINVNTHLKKTPEQEEEDLAILDEI